jgi:argininosuccinate lyase
MSVARGGRLPTAIDEAMQKINTSVQIDSMLWREDIQGSIAHTHGLVEAGILSKEEGQTIIGGLSQVATEIDSGGFTWDPAKEDVHMNIEARLLEIVGPVGGKLHTARSRNDQVATDLRLWIRARLDEIIASTSKLAMVLIERSADEIDTLMPSYTHLQRAQPSRLSHHLMAWQEMLWRDRGRLCAARRRANESPLGSGAVAGSGYPLDRGAIALEMEFRRPMRNSIDATASRDFLMESASALAILAIHLSRIGEEIVLWSSQEFGFISLSDAFSTSSSMMPQKKNPDVAELVRGKSAVCVGSLVSLLMLEKSLCLGYGRDLQEDKRPIFEAVDAANTSLLALAGALATATFCRDKMRSALDGGHICATDLADYLVGQGVPFREAHHLVGALVRRAEQDHCLLRDLPLEVLQNTHPALSSQAALLALDPTQSVENRRLLGGPAKVRVLEAISDARGRWMAENGGEAILP